MGFTVVYKLGLSHTTAFTNILLDSVMKKVKLINMQIPNFCGAWSHTTKNLLMPAACEPLFLFLPHFDVISDLLLNRHMET